MARGGKREGAGRKPGSKDTAAAGEVQNLSVLARTYTVDAINALWAVATGSASDAAKVSAAVAILDRGYGRPMQMLEHTGADGGPIATTTTTPREMARAVLSILRDAGMEKPK